MRSRVDRHLARYFRVESLTSGLSKGIRRLLCGALLDEYKFMKGVLYDSSRSMVGGGTGAGSGAGGGVGGAGGGGSGTSVYADSEHHQQYHLSSTRRRTPTGYTLYCADLRRTPHPPIGRMQQMWKRLEHAERLVYIHRARAIKAEHGAVRTMTTEPGLPRSPGIPVGLDLRRRMGMGVGVGVDSTKERTSPQTQEHHDDRREGEEEDVFNGMTALDLEVWNSETSSGEGDSAEEEGMMDEDDDEECSPLEVDRIELETRSDGSDGSDVSSSSDSTSSGSSGSSSGSPRLESFFRTLTEHGLDPNDILQVCGRDGAGLVNRFQSFQRRCKQEEEKKQQEEEQQATPPPRLSESSDDDTTDDQQESHQGGRRYFTRSYVTNGVVQSNRRVYEDDDDEEERCIPRQLLDD